MEDILYSTDVNTCSASAELKLCGVVVPPIGNSCDVTCACGDISNCNIRLVRGTLLNNNAITLCEFI